jgi:Spermidine synthase tetramerisation domain
MTENGENKVTIDAQRAKMAFLFREDIAPGLRLEMDLNRIFFTSESAFQQIDVVETYFGKVRGPSLRL